MTNEKLTMEQLEGIAGGHADSLHDVKPIPGGQPYPPTPKPVFPDKPIYVPKPPYFPDFKFF